MKRCTPAPGHRDAASGKSGDAWLFPPPKKLTQKSSGELNRNTPRTHKSRAILVRRARLVAPRACSSRPKPGDKVALGDWERIRQKAQQLTDQDRIGRRSNGALRTSS